MLHASPKIVFGGWLILPGKTGALIGCARIGHNEPVYE
jgi:hypothetical protein